jgi:polysaccharide biosynthesis protein PslH
VNVGRPRLAFFSPLFLFPNDAGGKIRTTNILRGLKGGAFEIRLLSPATAEQQRTWANEIAGVCDEFVPWHAQGPRPKALRALDLMGELPVNVAADVSAAARAAVQNELERGDVDLMVFDFVHASVYRPPRLPVKSVCFTHNVEAEIFQRHAATARGPFRRWLWSSQHAKMRRFEGRALKQFDQVIAVSERDAHKFHSEYGLERVTAIPTGVDLDYFAYAEAAEADDATAGRAAEVVFVGSMDSAANIGGVEFFLREVWPRVLAALPQARFRVVGRHPPAALVASGRRAGNVEFTGSVPDVRPFMRAAQVSVIPLLVGGGTRIKAFESMAIGCPVVSTTLGVEGLSLDPGEHYLAGDSAESMAAGVLQLLRDPAAGRALARRARGFVEARFGHRVAAQVFEQICQRALAAEAA